MYRINIPVPLEEDFPEVIVAQRMGDGFEKEYVEYEPRWRSDKGRRTIVVDEKCFYAMADTSERLKAENAELRELVQNLRRVTPADVVGVVIGANTDHPSYYKFDEAFRELGIEVD